MSSRLIGVAETMREDEYEFVPTLANSKTSARIRARDQESVRCNFGLGVLISLANSQRRWRAAADSMSAKEASVGFELHGSGCPFRQRTELAATVDLAVVRIPERN